MTIFESRRLLAGFFYFYRMDFLKNPAFILRALIAFAYVGLGMVLFVNPKALPILSPGMRYAFAVLLFAYGVFRGYRAWNMYKNDDL